MRRQVSFTFNLNSTILEAFQAAASAENKSADQVIEELMQRYVSEHDEQDFYGADNQGMPEEAYNIFFEKKVKVNREAVAKQGFVSNEEIEKEFSQRRAALIKHR